MELFEYGFFRNAFSAALLMSISCGIIGTYIVTRRMVFISGGITHASFGGVGIGYFFGIPPLVGAAIFAVVAALTTENLTRRKILRNDSIIAITWSLGMAIGIIFIYLTPGYAPNLMSFLFGSIITVTLTDLLFMLVLTLAVTMFFMTFYRTILYISFDEQFAKTRGIPVMLMNYLLIILVALTIVLSIRIAGIILILSLLTIPQNTANLFTNRFGRIITGSIITGFLASVIGLYVSYLLNIPSGATIIFILVVIYLLGRLLKFITLNYHLWISEKLLKKPGRTGGS
ncbi:MAG TPA: metal ABC transporter permease [Bacteroidaceae bacterium]|nr:metal ABC transporter permease [Bacteroidaceae bacterium]